MWCEIYNLSVDAVHELGKTGLAVGSLVLVDDMLSGSHVETLGDGLEGSLGLLGVALGDGGLDVLGQRLELGLDSLVTHASCLIGADTLLLRLDVCHFWSSFRVPCKKCMTPLRHGEVMQAPTIARSPSKG